MRRGGERCEPEGGRAWGAWWRHTRGMQGEGPTQGFGAKGTRGAHVEHEVHVRDTGGIEAQRLVEGPRELPSRREGMQCGEGEVRAGRREGLWCGRPLPSRREGMRCGAGEVGAGRRESLGCMVAAHKRHARGKGPTQGFGAKGTRGAHVEHAAHVRDAGGIEAQRLVEGRRVLPSRREGMRCGGERCEPGGGRAC